MGAEVEMSRPVLLDSSFLIALERESSGRLAGPAKHFLPRLSGRKMVVSVVTIEEVLEGAADRDAALESLKRFVVQGVHLAQAQRCAALRAKSPRRMGENDAWLVATAELLDADVVGADRIAFSRLGGRYLRFR